MKSSIDSDSIYLPFGLRLAKLAATKSTLNIKMGASLILNKNTFIAACNSKRTSPMAKKFFRFENQSHAEMNLFSKQLLEKLPLKKGVVYVYREFANGLPALARPCKYCLHMLGEIYGIKSIVYSTDGGYTKETI